MKIAVSAGGTSLDADIDPRFGRCRNFIVVDPATGEYESVDNSSAIASGGAGIAAAQMIAGKGVSAVLTGNCGPNAYDTLSAAGIQVITGVSGKIKDAVEQYRQGNFKTTTSANVPDHYGVNASSGMPGGMGAGGGVGRGMGGGMGRGMGMGRGLGRGMGGGMMPQSVSSGSALENEIQTLKAESQQMSRHLAEIQRRLDILESKKS